MSDYLDKIQTQKKDGTPLATVPFRDSAAREDITTIQNELTTDTTTIEGNPLNFTTLSAQKSKSTIIDIEPIQDLHGYDKPWVGGAGKNKLPMTVDDIKALNTNGSWSGNTYSYRNVTIEVKTDNNGNVNGFKLNGTSNNEIYFQIYSGKFTEGNYIGSKGTSEVRPTFSVYSIAKATNIVNVATSEASFTVDSQDANNVNIYLFTPNAYTYNNSLVYPMIRLSTESDPTFQPYTNIALISGRSEIGILGCGKNLIDWKFAPFNDNPLSITLKQGIYTLSAQSEMPQGNAYIRGTKQNGSYCTKAELRVGGWSESSTPGIYYGGASSTNYTITIPEDNVLIEFGKLNTDGTVSAQLEKGNQATTYEPYTKSTDLTISFGQTVYGGTLDVEKGKLVVDRAIEDLGNLSWTYNTTLNTLWFSSTSMQSLVKKPATNDVVMDIISSAYYKTSRNAMYNDGTLNSRIAINVDGNILIRDKRYTDATEFTSEVTGQKICYELATPITISLTPHIINLLKGVNNISTDGDKITLTYRDGSVATLGDLTSAVDSLDAKIEDSKILTDTATGDKYILVVTNGVLDIQQVSN